MKKKLGCTMFWRTAQWPLPLSFPPVTLVMASLLQFLHCCEVVDGDWFDTKMENTLSPHHLHVESKRVWHGKEVSLLAISKINCIRNWGISIHKVLFAKRKVLWSGKPPLQLHLLFIISWPCPLWSWWMIMGHGNFNVWHRQAGRSGDWISLRV